MSPAGDFVRFRIDIEKCIQGVHWLAEKQPGITQYYIGKVFFFADREHLLDWGRPITGDRYVAMEHGPVPSSIYDLLKDTSGEPDEIVDALTQRVDIISEGNKRHVYPKDGDNSAFSALSNTDKEYLVDALSTYGKMAFGELKRLSHLDRAFKEAWANPGVNNEMDIRFWFDADDPQQQRALQQLQESSSVIKLGQLAA